jgi:hypothetical protein
MTLFNDLTQSLIHRRRGDILHCLRDQPGRMAATTTIQSWLAERKFTTASTAAILGDLAYLRDLNLVLLMAEGTAARITAAGVECANDQASYPGVARPLPE